MIEVAIVDLITKNSGIIALIGDRIYPLRLPQDVIFPAMTYSVISNPEGHITHWGNPRIQLDVFSERFLEGRDISTRIKNLLRGYSGIDNTNAVKIKQIVFINWQDIPEMDNLYRVSMDFKILNETI